MITIEGMTVGGLIDPAEIEVKYMHKPEGKGYSAQKDLENYFRENVWNDPSLSNDSKIAIMVANYDVLTPDQKKDYNMLGDARALKCGDFCDWVPDKEKEQGPPVAWPGYLGLDIDKKVEGLSPDNLPHELDRIGSLFGSNFGTMRENGEPYTQDDRSITYLDNEYAYHTYDVDTENYFVAMDCIINFEKGKTYENEEDNPVNRLNALIMKKNDEKPEGAKGLDLITEDDLIAYKKDYDKFIDDLEVKKIIAKKKVDAKYGLIGQAAPWNVNENSIGRGGAGQLNLPVKGNVLADLGILIER